LLWARLLTCCAGLSLLLVVLLWTDGVGYGDESAADSPGVDTDTGAVSKPQQSTGLTPEQKRTYARLFARWWLPTLLLLIIFVVVLMVVTRTLKNWVLGRSRPVRFDPVKDVWSQTDNTKLPGGKKER